VDFAAAAACQADAMVKHIAQRQYISRLSSQQHAQASAPNSLCQLASTLHAIAAETELEGVRHEVEAAQGQAQYLNQQWADIHADLLEERDSHEVCTPITSCPHPSLHNALLM